MYKNYVSPEEKDIARDDFDPRILQIGFEHNSPGWYNLEHSHKSCELIYLLKGRESLVYDGRRYEAAENDVLLIDADINHQEFASSDTVREAIVVTFDRFRFPDLPENHLIEKGVSPVVRLEADDPIADLFQVLLEESRNENYMGYSMVSAALKMILVRILRKVGKGEKGRTTSFMECEKVKDYIDENYGTKITLDDLADIAYISKGHLSHQFKIAVGEAPIRYLINKRIEVAKDLLINSDLSIADIAYKVGYDNQTYFSQFFDKEVGMSPTAYRKKQRLI